jgi:serine/threonine-protein kinase
MIMDQRRTSGSPADRQSHWAPVDRYQPCFELASGGMATVYLARVTARAGFDRFVALKRIHPHLLKEPGFVEMFLDEARVASCIVHPNVCSVFDYEAQGDRHYIAMEYLMGEPLSRVSHAMQERAGALSDERACSLIARIIADACEGLHAAHELRDSEGGALNVVHRDVSPQNLFLTYDGAVKVVDFGLVRTAHCIHKTKTGIVKGKFAYLAPETLANKPLDRRADIWALGVVLWELITQRRLFQRDNEADTILAVATQAIEPPSVVRPGVPVALDKIVQKALARDPAERYATARDLGRELIRFIHQGAEPVGLSDLAEWMNALFPGGRARKLQLQELAGQLGSDLPTITVACSTLPALASALPTIARPPNESSVIETLPPPSVPAVTADRVSSQMMRRRQWPTAATAAALVAAVACGSLAMSFFQNRSTGEGTAVAAAPSSLGRASVVSVAPERATSATPSPTAGANYCAPERGTYVLELVPAPDGEAPRLVLRPIARDATRP